MSRNRIFLVAGCGALTAALTTGGALASSVPTLKTHAAYYTASKQSVRVNLVTSATNPKQILAGPAPIGSQYATGGIYLTCPKAPKRIASLQPFAGVAFPALTLKRGSGHYQFTKTFKDTASILGSTNNTPMKLTVTFTGTVTSSTVISGSVGLKGASACTAVKSASYKAKYNSKATVAPGA